MISKTIGFRGTLFSDKPIWIHQKYQVEDSGRGLILYHPYYNLIMDSHIFWVLNMTINFKTLSVTTAMVNQDLKLLSHCCAPSLLPLLNPRPVRPSPTVSYYICLVKTMQKKKTFNNHVTICNHVYIYIYVYIYVCVYHTIPFKCEC